MGYWQPRPARPRNALLFMRDSNPLTDWSQIEGDIAREIGRMGNDQ